LHKTIVFVTHDIDEALRLGARVAVFKGGVLQQYDEPAHLLSRPANEFVARFIGLGRGYRWLQLMDAAGLPLHDVERIAQGGVADSGLPRCWAVVVDDAGAPVGWIDAEGLRRHRAGAPLPDSVTGVGSLFRPDGNLSQALDAALSSPSGMGLAVDDGGKLIGGVLAADVLAAVEARRRD
jgi:osmoprotectant transport system ATP-binding protein